MAAIESVRASSGRAKRGKGEDIPTPDQRMYGVFQPQYASYLAQTAAAQGPTDSAALAALNAGALRSNAKNEARDYADMLSRAQVMQAEENKRNAYYGILEDNAENLQGDVDRGMGGVRGTPVFNEQTGVYEVHDDPLRVQIANADKLNTTQQERFTGYAGAIKTLRDAGVAVPDNYMGELLTPPTQTTPVPIESGTTPLTPGAATDRYSADEGLTAEQQMEIARTKAAAAENGDEIKVKVVQGEGGVRDYTFEGTPEALARNGIDPKTGRKVSPNAGTQGGGVPATTAAPEATNRPPETSDRIDLNAASVLGSRFGRVTSTTRSAEHNKKVGGVKNSYHLSGRAIDIARAKGVKHKDIETAYKNAGYKLIESLDEGDHSHLAFSRGPLDAGAAEHAYATRLKTHPLVAGVKIVNGQTLVTMKDGTQRVYQKGRRIG